MVKTDDYMESSAADFDMKEKEEIMTGGEEDGNMHRNWQPPRSKSAGLKYAEYESDDSGGHIPNSKKTSMDCEIIEDRRLRRQIANCNERRRMQSINAGFQALRQLLPRKDGDKMSKASILAATADFIQNLLHERAKLLEENAMSAAKRRRLDVGERNGAPTPEELPMNVIECIKTIGELRDLLQKETQTRMTYEKELLDLRTKLSAFPSPVSSNDLSPNSSASSTGNNHRNLLIEFAQRQQQEPQLYRPTPITPATADVNLLSSAIASLANNSPPGAVQSQGLLNTLGINNQQQSSFSLSAPNASLFVGVGSSHQQPNIPVVQQQSAGLPTQIQHTVETQASISQRNLQALVLAIRHLEGGSGSNGNLLVR